MASDKDIRLIIEAIDNTERAFKNLQSKLGALQGQARRTEGVFSRLSNRLNNSFNRLSRSLFNLRNLIVGAFATGSIGLFTRSVINTASEIEILKLRLRAVGQDGEEAFKTLHAWASKLPISTKDAIDMFITLQAYGLKPSIDQMNILVDTILAMGGSTEVLQRIGLALGQIYTKGKLAAQEMIQLSNAGIPIREILAEGLGVTTQQLEELLEQGIDSTTALTIIFEGLRRRFGGTAKEYENTWAGLVERLRSVWFDFKKEVAETGAFEKLKQALKNFVDWASSKEGMMALNDLAKSVGEGLVIMAEVSIGAFELLLSTIQGVINVFRDLDYTIDQMNTKAKGWRDQLIATWKAIKGEIDIKEWQREIFRIEQETEGALGVRYLEYITRDTQATEEHIKRLEVLKEKLKEIRTELSKPTPSPSSPIGEGREKRKVPIFQKVPIEPTIQFPTSTPSSEIGRRDIRWIWDEEVWTKAKENAKTFINVWAEASKSFQVNAKAMVESLRTIGYSIEYNLLNVLDPLSEKFMRFGDIAKRILREIYREFLRLALIRPLISSIFGYFGGGGVEAGVSVSLMGRHLGGYIPKFHYGGLANDEVFALLKKGEFVLSREAVNQLGLMSLQEFNRGGGAKGGGMIVVNINAVDTKSFQDLIRRNKGAIIEPIMEDLRKSGTLRYEIMEGIR